jgi:hypothetical protein
MKLLPIYKLEFAPPLGMRVLSHYASTGADYGLRFIHAHMSSNQITGDIAKIVVSFSSEVVNGLGWPKPTISKHLNDGFLSTARMAVNEEHFSVDSYCRTVLSTM